ncbi:MAG: glycosyltransferase family 4 protein [Pseudomonadota bacterium]
MGDPNGGSAPGEEVRPLTVMQLVPRLDSGGVERGTIEMVDAIVSAGGRALVATAGGTQSIRVSQAGGELVLLDMATKNPYTIWRNASRLSELIEEQGIDVVHARSRAPAWSGYLATRQSGKPFVTTYHGTYSEGLPFKRLYNSVMARGRPVIAISEFIRKLVLERHKVSDEDIVVIPRGADINVFTEDAVGNERVVKLMERWNLLDDTRPVIMLPARLTRWKGAESVIDAAARLKGAIGGESFLVLIVGDDLSGGEFARELDNRIQALDVQDCVHCVGGTTDMAAAYKLAAVVISASIEPEAFGRVIVEAQAMGRPVIATDHGGARETVIHGESGWLYPPGDPEALSDAMGLAIGLEASERAHMGMAARVRVHSQYTVTQMQRSTLDVYEAASGRTFVRGL